MCAWFFIISTVIHNQLIQSPEVLGSRCLKKMSQEGDVPTRQRDMQFSFVPVACSSIFAPTTTAIQKDMCKLSPEITRKRALAVFFAAQE